MTIVRVSDAATQADAFAGVVARLRLTQGEVRILLGGAPVDAVLPGLGDVSDRAALVAAALSQALDLVCDDELVGMWLRSPLPRRGGVSPLEEAEAVLGDVGLRFVLRPHPSELVRLVSQRAARALDARLSKSGRTDA